MHLSTLTISSKGQIVLPKKVRRILNSNVVSLEINANNQILISPVQDLGGMLSAYKKDTDLSFKEIREEAWSKNTSKDKK